MIVISWRIILLGNTDGIFIRTQPTLLLNESSVRLGKIYNDSPLLIVSRIWQYAPRTVILINDKVKINMNLPKQDQPLGVREPYLTFDPNT